MSKMFSAGCRRRLALTAVLFGGALALPTVASAATCAFAPATVPATVTVTLPGSETATVGRNVAGNIQVNGTNCSTATVTNTDLIKIVGATGAFNQNVNLTLANGPLGPGKTAETGTGAVAEIELQIQLGAGFDQLMVLGSASADRITVGTLGLGLNADADADASLSGLDGAISIAGMANNDLLSGAGGAGTGSPTGRGLNLMGGAGNDTLTGGRYVDSLFGDANVSGGPPVAAGADLLFGGDSSDQLHAHGGNDLVEGQNHHDTLFLDLGNDTYRGGDGFDFFRAEGFTGAPDGADLISGGRHDDTLDLRGRTHNLRISLDNLANDGADTTVPPDGVADEGDNIQADVEDFFLGNGNDFLNANTVPANALAAVNSVFGDTGHDTLHGGEGDDFLSGESGNDLLLGHAGDDNLDGSEGADYFAGDAGDDDIDAGPGADTSFGDAGDDFLWQGASSDGADFISGGLGHDHAYFASRSTNTLIRLDNVVSLVPGLKGNDGADVDQNGVAEEGDDVRADVEEVSTGSGNDLISANTGPANAAGVDNIIDGGANNDRIDGGAGDDRLEGSNGNDILTGGPGEDTLNGDAGADDFFALDGFWDMIDGGFDAATDVDEVKSADPFDARTNIP